MVTSDIIATAAVASIDALHLLALRVGKLLFLGQHTEFAAMSSLSDLPGSAGLRMTAHTITVPLDYNKPEAASIQVFFRVVNSFSGTRSEEQFYLLYLQGRSRVFAYAPSLSAFGTALSFFEVTQYAT